MKQLDADNRLYQCDQKEVVTVTLTPSDPVNFSASYTYSDETSGMHIVDGNKIEFTMNSKFKSLAIDFHFFSAGGTCQVDLSGSKSGSFTDPNDPIRLGTDPVIGYWTFQV